LISFGHTIWINKRFNKKKQSLVCINNGTVALVVYRISLRESSQCKCVFGGYHMTVYSNCHILRRLHNIPMVPIFKQKTVTFGNKTPKTKPQSQSCIMHESIILILPQCITKIYILKWFACGETRSVLLDSVYLPGSCYVQRLFILIALMVYNPTMCTMLRTQSLRTTIRNKNMLFFFFKEL